MSSLYPRGKRLWAKVKVDGVWKNIPTGYSVGEEAQARAALRDSEKMLADGESLDEAMLKPPTVKVYVKRWLKAREEQGMACAKDERSRLVLHAVPVIGQLQLAEVRPHHIRDLVRLLKKKQSARGETMAPRTVHHVYGTLHRMFHDAVVEELILANPCVLGRGELPRKVDRDPMWRPGAIFSAVEVETLISHPDIPLDRRVVYALLFLGGMRFGEVSALRWRAYDPERKPLGRLLVAFSYSTKQHREKSVKTERPREVPVHPVLASILAAWKLSGWQGLIGRKPEEGDLIIPSRKGDNRNVNHGMKRFSEDLERVGLRRRRQHDTRRTFVSLAEAGGARKDVLRWVTHGPSGDIMDLYTTLPWPTLCEAVKCLKIARRRGEVVKLAKCAGVDGRAEKLGTVLGTDAVRHATGKEKAPGWRELGASSVLRGGRDSNPRPPA